MTTTNEPAMAAPTARPPVKRRGSVRRILRGAVATRRGQVGLALTLLVVGLAFVGPFVPARSATEFSAPPYSLPGDGNGILGTDALGRDVLARILHGGWGLLTLAAISTVLAVLLGTIAGVVAAYRGRMSEMVIMRSVDVMLAIPQLVFVLLIVSVIGAKTWLLVVAVTLCQAPQVARVMYASAQDICERDFVKAVALWGTPPRTVIRRHIMPSLTTPLGGGVWSATEFFDHPDCRTELPRLRDSAPQPVLGRDGEREQTRPGDQLLGCSGPSNPVGNSGGGDQCLRRCAGTGGVWR